MTKRTYKDALLNRKSRKKRCKNGTRRNARTGRCEKPKRRLRSNSRRTRRCPNGSRRKPAKTGQCRRKSATKKSGLRAFVDGLTPF